MILFIISELCERKRGRKRQIDRERERERERWREKRDIKKPKSDQ